MKRLILTLFIMLLGFANANTIDDKISQMIILGFEGNNVNDKGFQRILKEINSISGVILFSKNIENFR
ncbi:hypothetical protein IJ531_05270, partial [bacterium]|nr:hypothetical protein [bacterium]